MVKKFVFFGLKINLKRTEELKVYDKKCSKGNFLDITNKTCTKRDENL